jgi:glycosyltransferase 2 family protein
MNQGDQKQEETLKKAFRTWKIWVAVLFGISVASFMMYQNLLDEHYIQVETGKGDYKWVDKNHDHIPNLNDPKEFTKTHSGNYTLETISNTLGAIDWTIRSFFWISAALVCMIGRDLFYMIRIRLLTAKRLSWKSSFSVILLWEFASALSPGIMSGAFVAMFILNREKISLGKSTAIVIITAFMDNLFYVVMVPLVLLFINQEYLFSITSPHAENVKWIFWFGYSALICLCIFLFSSLFLFPKLPFVVLGNVFRLPFLRKWRQKTLKTAQEIKTTSQEFKNESFGFWIRVFLTTVASWTSRYLVINCILNAFLSLSSSQNIQLFGKQFVLWLFMRMSPTPGGSGVAEYAFGELLANFSSSGILIVALAILWRMISYFPYLLIGAVILPKWLQKSL